METFFERKCKNFGFGFEALPENEGEEEKKSARST